MKPTLSVSYGQTEIALEADERRVAFDLQPADVRVDCAPFGSAPEGGGRGKPAAGEVAGEVRRAMEAPIGAPRLRELAAAGREVVIIADDITRLTPTDKILPVVLDELNAGGVSDEAVTCVIALGTHRAMTEAEIARKFGPAVTGRIRVVNHDAFDAARLTACGTTRRGTDIRVSAEVLAADVRVGVGNIVPHMPTGWSGGAKILLPGVAGELTTGQMHLLGATELQLGRLETPCRREMEDFAGSVGLDFIVNTVLDRRGRLVRAAAGHFIEAHREGVAWAERVFGAPFRRPAEVVLASTAPIDFDLFQAGKGLFSAARCTAAGGEIILLSPCHEGVSPTHGQTVELGRLDDAELWRLARPGSGWDVLSITSAMYFNAVKRHCRVTLASEGIAPGDAARLGFGHVAPGELGGYLAGRLAAAPAARVGILRYAVETLPLQRE